jgi:GT2 family glycosyltransferase
MSTTDNITAIINGYRRYSTLEEQYNSISKQTAKPVDIMFWQNYHQDCYDEFSKEIISKCKSSICNYNLGVWARFAYALNAKTKYICIFDDDTIPGVKWFENCLETIKTHRGLLGTRGIIFPNANSYHHSHGIGWETANEQTVRVDIVGHCWFFEREWLAAYWAEMPPPEYFFAGEDMHFSYAIQKHYGLHTYVPPHPSNDKRLWGSLKAVEYGNGKEATSNFAIPEMYKYLNYITNKGFKIINS